MMEIEADISIVEFDAAYAKDFADLNYEWIAKGYGIEDHDREILDAPLEYVIRPGGQIFFAIVGESVGGTVALIPIDSENFELAKMAVSPDFRGLGVGDRLMSACIEYSTRNGMRKIILESNTKQVAAINLYRKFNFKETSLDPNSPYQRANIRMELVLA
ncbi:MAG: GNAT family N-acetyltransferase [Saprospiraceae bacterium]|nr:GNAT family N-acetyltransferase [Pyrinomonadaceae bacterium]